ncbi:MAG: hypothetical protein ACLPWF_27670 [Bryobacteraceae bacterium]
MTRVLAGSTLLLAMYLPLAAQWLRYPSTGVPRTADGKPNLTAPAARTSDGKPDFSGVWMTGNPVPCDPVKGADLLDCDAELPIAWEAVDIAHSLPGGLPYQPWAAALVKQRMQNEGKDDPHVRCLPLTVPRNYGLPHLSKIVQTPGLLLILTEWNAGYRQIFTDARPLPVDPQPSWNGYSSGKWEGDTLVVQTIGLRDDLWLDLKGDPLTEAAKLTERFRRPTYGRLEIEFTVDDPKAYTKPWTITFKQAIVPDAELLDEICLENEKSFQHLPGK